MSEAGTTVEEPTLSTPAADVAHLLRRAGFEGTSAEIAALTPMDLPAIVDTLLDFTPNPADTPPASLGDPNKGDWERMQDLIKWWLDRMATVPHPLQEKLALFWHGHFATQVSKVGSAKDMFDQNHLFRTAGAGSFESLVQQMSLQVAMLIYLDNDPNSKGSPNENFARELLELFTLGVNQYTQADVVAAARAWTGHNVDYDANPRVYRFYPERHDTVEQDLHGHDPELGRPADHHPHPHRRAAALDRGAVHREEAVDVLRVPQPDEGPARRSRRRVRRLDPRHPHPRCARSSCGPSSTAPRRGRDWSARRSSGS